MANDEILTAIGIIRERIDEVTAKMREHKSGFHHDTAFGELCGLSYALGVLESTIEE